MSDHARPYEEENVGFKGWSACARAMHEYDERLVRRWCEEIDTLLVFAGLFSAVLTAFTIESYPLLQQNPTGSSFAERTPLSLIETQPTLMKSPFQPPASAVRINVMWVTALVASLVSALLGILVKSWLREFSNRGLTSPRESVRMRQFRYDGLIAWRMSDIVASLPLLLQFALVLFLVGLLDLLWTVNRTVAIWTTVIVSSSFLVIFASFIAPIFQPSCPYKSTLTLQVMHILHLFTSIVAFRSGTSDKLFATWWEHDRQAVAVQADRATGNLDHSALEWSHRHLLDDDFLDSVVPCTSELAPGTRAHSVIRLIANTADMTSWNLIQMLRQSPENSAMVEQLQRQLLRAGHRVNSRLLRLVLDVLPDALPDMRPIAITTTTAGRFSLMNGLPGIMMDDSALRTSHMLAMLHVLLSPYTLTGRSDEKKGGLLVPRVFEELMSLIYSRPQQLTTLEKVFHLFERFSHILHPHVKHDDVKKMVQTALRSSAKQDGHGFMPYSRVGTPYGNFVQLLVRVSGVAIHYYCVLDPADRQTPDLRKDIQDLLCLMERHVMVCNNNNRPYHTLGVLGVWCWELCRLVRQDARLLPLRLLEALEESQTQGRIHPSEQAPLTTLRMIFNNKSLTVVAKPMVAAIGVPILSQSPVGQSSTSGVSSDANAPMSSVFSTSPSPLVTLQIRRVTSMPDVRETIPVIKEPRRRLPQIPSLARRRSFDQSLPVQRPSLLHQNTPESTTSVNEVPPPRPSMLLRPLRPRRRRTIDAPRREEIVSGGVPLDSNPSRSPPRRRRTLEDVPNGEYGDTHPDLLPLPAWTLPPIPRRSQTPVGRPIGPRQRHPP